MVAILVRLGMRIAEDGSGRFEKSAAIHSENLGDLGGSLLFFEGIGCCVALGRRIPLTYLGQGEWQLESNVGSRERFSMSLRIVSRA